jgi:enterochelin esterase family protein
MRWLVLLALFQPALAEPPAVHANRSVTLTLGAPAATSVRAWGDWQRTETGEPMRRLDDGTWTVTTPPLSPGPHLYAFIVDGLRMADPGNRRVKNGYPGVSSIVEIPDPSLAGLPRGIVHVHTFAHPESGRTRTVHVYTPAGFTTRSRLPVLYLLHGSSDSDRDWLVLGQAGQLLERAVRAGTASPMLLVMPDGHPYPSLDVSTRVENLRLLQREVVEAIGPLVERDYHPAPGVARRAILGASMGGAQALHLAAREPSLFGTVAGLSTPADVPRGETLAQAWRRRPTSAPPVRVTLLCGTDDPFLEEARQAPATLKSLGTAVEWVETPGAHDWSTWRDHLGRVLPRLFR